MALRHLADHRGSFVEAPLRPGSLLPLGLALCHSVVIVGGGGGGGDGDGDGDGRLSSESPDEEALVRAAADLLQLRLTAASPSECVVNGEAWAVLAVLPFRPELRRMGVVVRCGATTLLLTKGADVAMAPFVGTSPRVDEFAALGLRTLVFGGLELPGDEADRWLAEVYAPAAALVEGRADAVAAAFAQLEPRQALLGVSGVEDALQELVPETVGDLLRAGLRVAVLTGDKLETAVSVSRSAGLLGAGATESLLVLGETTLPPVTADTTLVVTGAAAAVWLAREPRRFCEAFLRCRAAVCCRMTPGVKAAVVRMVKRSRITCLAIGDGANDVSMLREAHVGVGLFGKEGVQAANAADFALHRFHHLRRLLFVHGRLAYVRISLMVCFDFFKNMAFNLPMFFFNFYNGFTGQTLFSGMLMSCFNTLFTTPALLALALVAKDVPEAAMLDCPRAYFGARGRVLFNARVFAAWMAAAAAFAAANFWLVLPVAAAEGLGLWGSGLAVLLANVWGILAVLAVTTQYWTRVNLAMLLVCAGVLPLVAGSYASWYDVDIQGAFAPVWRQPSVVLAMGLFVGAAGMAAVAVRWVMPATPEDSLRLSGLSGGGLSGGGLSGGGGVGGGGVAGVAGVAGEA